MAKPKPKPKVTAVKKLELSRIDPKKLRLSGMGEDIDLASFVLRLRKSISVNLIDRITEAELELTMEGASTLTVKVDDSDRTVLRSGRLSNQNDVEVDGMWFRLTAVDKQADEITLTFEDREIAVLRTYHKKKMASRTKATRAEFVLNLIREVKEFKIKYWIPQLRLDQPIEQGSQSPSWTITQDDGDEGIAKDNDLTVKGTEMAESHRKNANIILNVGKTGLYPRKMLVIAIMTAIQESTLTNLDYPKIGAWTHLSSNKLDNPVGVFQQRRTMGWAASRDVAKDAKSFYEHLAKIYRGSPNDSPASLAERTQNSGQDPGKTYGRWRSEAERIVAEYGYAADNPESANKMADPMTGTGGDYQYFRGIPPEQGQKQWKPENSWKCIQRLAQEVNWRAFFYAGKFHYASERRLFKQAPLLTLDENTPGVESIDGDYQQYSKSANLRVQCMCGKWLAKPGSVVKVRNMGPWNGRWLVASFKRSLFDNQAEIVLKKPRPALPEPAQDQLETEQSWNWADKAEPQKDDKAPAKPNTTLGAIGIVERCVEVAQKAGGEGVYVGSDYRPGSTVGSGAPSDHSGNDESRAARDIGVKGINLLTGPPSPKLDKAAIAIGKMFGKDWKQGPGEHTGVIIEDIQYQGFRVQVIWRTPKYGGHMGHIHVGAKRAGT